MDETKQQKKYTYEFETIDKKRLTTQKRVFTRWINSQLKQINGREVDEAIEIFRDAQTLYDLVKELASHVPTAKTFQPSDALSLSENAVVLIEKLYGADIASSIHLAVNLLKTFGNRDLSDLSSKHLLIFLDTLWMLIVAAGNKTGPVDQIKASTGSSTLTLTPRSRSAETPEDIEINSARTPLLDQWLTHQDERLLAWCQAITQDLPGINISNFTTSWLDGAAFLAIVNQQRPDLFSLQSRLEKPAVQNLNLAFHLCTREFTVPRLLESEDLSLDAMDAHSVAAYLIELRNAVESDRKRRSRTNFEIRTSAMEAQLNNVSASDLEVGVSVTLATTSSRSSSSTLSELTFNVEDEEDDEEASVGDAAVDSEEFQASAEHTLAWILSMEEKFKANFPEMPESGEEAGSPLSVDPCSPIEAEALYNLEKAKIEEAKKMYIEILQRLDDARKCFNVHEDLRAHLRKRELRVSRCLRFGQKLAALVERIQQASAGASNVENYRDSLKSGQAAEVVRMTSLIHERWIKLTRAAAAATKILADRLLKRQEALLLAVEMNLEKIEAEKERQANRKFGSSIPELKLQMSGNRQLETEIETGETLVHRLEDIVILVPTSADETTANSLNGGRDKELEGRIADLATRWGRVVDWIHTHYAKLQNALLHWRHFDEEADLLSDWLMEREQELRKVEAALLSQLKTKASENGSPTEKTMEVIRANHELVQEAVNNGLSEHESRWAQLLASLDRRARAVREACGDCAEVQRCVEQRVDALVSHWSQLTEPQLDWDEEDDIDEDLNNNTKEHTSHSVKIAESKKPATHFERQMEPDRSKDLMEGSPEKKKTKLNDEREEDQHLIEPEEITPQQEALPQSSQPTGYRAEFESRTEELWKWLDSSIVSLELVTMATDKRAEQEREAQQSGLHRYSQTGTLQEVVEKVGNEIEEYRESMVYVTSLGERYRRELSQAVDSSEESVEELDQVFREISDQWKLLEHLYAEAISQAGLQDVTETESTEASSIYFFSNIFKSVEIFKKWLQDAEETSTAPMMCSNEAELDEQTNRFNQIIQLQPTPETAGRFFATLETQVATELCNQLQEVQNHINERSMLLDLMWKNYNFVQTQLERYEKLMEDMDVYLKSVVAAQNTEPQGIDLQLQESKAALDDMTKEHVNLDRIDDAFDKLKPYFNPTFAEALAERHDELRLKWDSIHGLTEENIKFLRNKLQAALKQHREDEEEDFQTKPSEDQIVPVNHATQEMVGLPDEENSSLHVQMLDMSEFEKWMSEAKERLSKFKVINAKRELTEFGELLDAMKKEIDSKRLMIAAIRDGKAADVNGEQMTDTKILLFSGHFADLESEFSAATERLKSGTYHLNDFNDLLGYEKHWLDRIDLFVRKSKQQVYVDVQDISDDITNLENLRLEHSEDDYKRLKLLSEQLRNEAILDNFVTAEYDTYTLSTEAAMKKIAERISELNNIRERTQSTQARLDEYEAWLKETGSKLQDHIENHRTASSREEEFKNWCAHVGSMDEMVATVKMLLATHSEANSEQDDDDGRVGGEALSVHTKGIQTQSLHFKRRLLYYFHSLEFEESLVRCFEEKQRQDLEAGQLIVTSLVQEDISGLLQKCANLEEEVKATGKLIEELLEQVTSTEVPIELKRCNKELEADLQELLSKKAKIAGHITHFSGVIQMLKPLSEEYTALMVPLEEALTNVEEITDYLESVNTQDSLKDMLEMVLTKLNKLLESEEDRTVEGSDENQVTTVAQLEDVLKRIEAAGNVDGLETAVASARRSIEKAFAARDAVKQQLESMNDGSDVSPSTIKESIVPQLKSLPPSITVQAASPPDDDREILTTYDVDDSMLSQIYASSNQLTSEMCTYFEDVASFNNQCINTAITANRENGDSVKQPETKPELVDTCLTECIQRVDIFTDLFENYFKQQAQYLDSRLNKLLKISADLSPEAKKMVMQKKTFWTNSRADLYWHVKQIDTLADALRDTEAAFTDYEVNPIEETRRQCLAKIDELEKRYNWRLAVDRARVNVGQDKNITAIGISITKALKDDRLPQKLRPFRQNLQQLASQLNEIQQELSSCQHVPTHQLDGCIRNLDQFFVLAQEAYSNLKHLLKQMKEETYPRLQKQTLDMLDTEPNLSDFNWFEAILETQKGRLTSYCNEFHVCRPYWQEYATLWKTFTNEAVQQKHQIEMLQINRLPVEKREQASVAGGEVNMGTLRDHAVNLCSSALTLQRLGSKLVWKAEYSEIAVGLDADLYLQPVFDKRFRRRPLRHKDTLRNDIAFVNDTFAAVHKDLVELSIQHEIENFLPPNLKIDPLNVEEARIEKTRSLHEAENFQETTFPIARSSCTQEEMHVSNVDACLSRLREEINWLKEKGIYVPLTDTPANYISKLDSEFWRRNFETETNVASHPPKLSSNWVRQKSAQLSKMDASLRSHERRAAQLCLTAEKLGADSEDSTMRNILHESAYELHLAMESARGVMSRRRTRLTSWLTMCTTLESAMLMNRDGDEVVGEQTLPVWIATIRQRLQSSGSNLTSPVFHSEIEQLRAEFDPTGHGTGATLRSVETALQSHQHDLEMSQVSTHLRPRLYAKVVSSVITCLREWNAVCSLLRIEGASAGNQFDQDLFEMPTTPKEDMEAIPSPTVQSAISRKDALQSPTSVGFRSEQNDLLNSLRKLSFWLDSVSMFMYSNKASLGGEFDQEAVLARLKQSMSNINGQDYVVKALYPAAIQIQLQQFALELEARRPQLDRLREEATRQLDQWPANPSTPDDNVHTPADLAAMVEEVRQSWNVTSAQVKARLDELEKMMAATDELKTLERDLDRWLSRLESDFSTLTAAANVPDSISPAERRRQVQEMVDRLQDGQDKFTLHQSKCESIISKYSKEDTQKIRSEQDSIQRRWSQLVSWLQDALEGNFPTNADFIEIPVTARSDSRVNSMPVRGLGDQTPSYRPNDGTLSTESRNMEVSMITAYPNHFQSNTYDGRSRPRLGKGPQTLTGSYHAGYTGRNDEFRQPGSSFGAKVPQENWPSFLAHLRQLNDWLAHREAGFQQIKGPIGSDSINVKRHMDKFLILEEEMKGQQFRVDDTLDQGQCFMDSRSGFFGESEGDSDSSELAHMNADADDAHLGTKRLTRRIHRHLNYLNRHWAELTKSMIAYRVQLDSAYQKLTVFERILENAESQLASAQHLLSSRGSNFANSEQTVQVLLDKCASVTHAITSLGNQALVLSENGTLISHSLISRLDGLKVGLERLRLETNDALNMNPDAPPTRHDVRSSLLQHRPPQPEEEGERSTSALISRPKSPAECWLQAFKTVSYPWERCLHPSGNQVPYYKNYSTQETTWDHPDMVELLQSLDEVNNVRFSAYRTALKMRKLQEALFLDQIPLNVATETFSRHGIASSLCSEGCDGRQWDVNQLVNSLTTLYCRVWDLLVVTPNVVKVFQEPALPSSTTEIRPHQEQAVCDNFSNESAPNNPDSKRSRQQKILTKKQSPSHRSKINCVQKVLCSSNSKFNYDADEDDDAPDGGRIRQEQSQPQMTQQQLNSSNQGSLYEQESEPRAPEGESRQLISDRAAGGGVHSRVEKLHTHLKLPDGRLFNLAVCVDLALNFLLNSFDSSRNGTIRVLSFKLTILLFVNCSIDEQYQHLFRLVANREDKIDDPRLWLLIYECMQIPRQLGETITSSSMEPSVRQCFKANFKSSSHEGQSKGQEEYLPIVGFDRFYDWLKLEPQMISWLPALYRLRSGYGVTHHGVKCAVCQSNPIVGIRYRCLRCMNFDLCQDCFLIGLVAKNHKLTHPIQEYTATLQRSESFRDLSRIIRNRFKSKESFRQNSLNLDNVLKSSPVRGGELGRSLSFGHTPISPSTPVSPSDKPPRLDNQRKQTSLDLPPISSRQAASVVANPGAEEVRELHGSELDDAFPPIQGTPDQQRQMAPRQMSAYQARQDQEHELIAQYSQSLRRQSNPNLAAQGRSVSGIQFRSGGVGWQMPYNRSAVWERSLTRLPQPDSSRFQYGNRQYSQTMKAYPPQHPQRSISFRASSQPPPVFMQHTDQIMAPIDQRYRPAGGSVGSLDKVLMNLEEENRFLRAEYERLRLRSPSQQQRIGRSPSQHQQYTGDSHSYGLEGSRYGHHQSASLVYPVMQNSQPTFAANNNYPNQGVGQHPVNLAQSQVDRGGLMYGGSLGRATGAQTLAAQRGGWERSSLELGRYPATMPPAAPMMYPEGSGGGEMATKARLLRQHETRLESRMAVLEDHNKQLEDQLTRLRHYLQLPQHQLGPAQQFQKTPQAPTIRPLESQSFDRLQQYPRPPTDYRVDRREYQNTPFPSYPEQAGPLDPGFHSEQARLPISARSHDVNPAHKPKGGRYRSSSTGYSNSSMLLPFNCPPPY